MSINLIIILVLAATLIIAGLAIFLLWNGRKFDKAMIKAQAGTISAQLQSIIERDELLKKFQEADDAASKQKDKMAAGTTSDRVAASVGVLSDIAQPKR